MSIRVAFWRAQAPSDTRWADVPSLAFTSMVAHARHKGVDVEPEYCATGTELVHATADVYAISAVTGAWPETLRVAHVLTALNRRVIIGGPHITCLPESLPCDCVGVLGEGEETFAELLADPAGPMYGNPGTARWHDEQLLTFPERPRLNLAECDHLPVFMDPRNGRVQAVATRGCPFRCWFCSAWRCWPQVSRLAPEHVARQLGEHFAETPGGCVTFQDLTFASNAAWVAELVGLLKEHGCPERFTVSGCSYSAKMADRGILTDLKSVGCEWVGVGIESASPRMIAKLKPHITMADNEKLLRLATEIGIQVHASFIVGTPGETAEDLEITRQFILEHKGPHFKQAGLFCFCPYPGTEAWDELAAKGKVSADMDFGLLTNGANPDKQQVFYCNEDHMPYEEMVTWRRKLSEASRPA
ncbi:MAG: B12-binding domain-containing radical SAM protein [bacterium]|nr:B12-binding domain-containing radical SAM protein [bacterium]